MANAIMLNKTGCVSYLFYVHSLIGKITFIITDYRTDDLAD